MQGFQAAYRNGGGFGIGQVGRFEGQRSTHHAGGFGHTFVLGIRAQTETGRGKDLVAGFELAHILADGFDFPGQLCARMTGLGLKKLMYSQDYNETSHDYETSVHYYETSENQRFDRLRACRMRVRLRCER